MFEHF